MGIRFYCPNGHKLNVKAFQAGMRGICPHCGTSVEIPRESTRPSSKELATAKRQQRQAQPTDQRAAPQAKVQRKEAEGRSSVHPSTSPVKAAAPLEDFPVGAPTQPSVAASTSPAGETASAPAGIPAPPRPGAANGARDPLEEAPTAAWYVRPPTGGQYGPATGDVMRIWIAEGRVSGDSLVWREGWRDWQEAGSVFPQLAPAERDAVPELRTMIEEEVYAPGPALAGRPATNPHRSDDASSNSGLVVIMMIALAAIVLVVIVLWLWLGSGGEKPARTSAAGTSPIAVLDRIPSPGELDGEERAEWPA